MALRHPGQTCRPRYVRSAAAQYREALQNPPLWALGLITVALVLLSVELGWRLGNHNRQRAEKEKEAPSGAVVGAALGLLACLLAFTFGMAATRYDTRKSAVLQEANAIGTTYLRADLLPGPQRDEIRSLLREYAALRVKGAGTIMSPEVMAKSAALHDRLWAIAATVDIRTEWTCSARLGHLRPE